MIALGKVFQRASSWPLSLAAALLFFIAGRDALATDIPAIVKAAKPAVVELFCYDQDGELVKSGTGFFISADGVLLTNYHLLEGGTYRISAKTLAGKLYTSMRILAAPNSESHPPQEDVAELQFTDAKEVPYLSLSSAEPLEGAAVMVIGNPEGYTGTVSTGIISAVRNRETVVQITAPISPGSSGSPVLDESGRVVGIATAYSAEGQNLNFAISAEGARIAIAKGHPTQLNQALNHQLLTLHLLWASILPDIESGDFSSALEATSQVIALRPNNWKGYAVRAQILDRMGEHSMAQEDRKKARMLGEPEDVIRTEPRVQ